MAVVAQTIVDRAQRSLLDDTGVRWTDGDLLAYLNDGQREIVRLKPDANAITTDMNLAVGTKQSIPAGGYKLVDVIANNGGAKRAITRIRRRDLDVTRPAWHSEPAEAEIKHYMHDDSAPTVFYVTPPSASTTVSVRLVYSAAPAEVALGVVISLDDIYATALYYYLMFRAHSVDSEAASPERAATYYTLFVNSFSGQVAAENS
jgi:hypothetical protein